MHRLALRTTSILLIVLISMYSPASASLGHSTPTEQWTEMKLSRFVQLSATRFSQLSGHRMNFRERLGFALLKRRMKHSLRNGEDVLVKDYLGRPGWRPSKWWHWLIVIALAIILIMAVVSVSKL